MSSKQHKKARKELRNKINVEGKQIVLSLQSLIIKFGFIKRLCIAYKIIRGKPFLGGTGMEGERENS